MTVALVWAEARGGIIGDRGAIPWRLPEDLAHFRELTLGDAVLMGRKTWDSLPERFRPLPGRRNLVLTRDDAWSSEGAEVVHSLADAVASATGGTGDAGSDGETKRGRRPAASAGAADAGALLWVIGGGELYRQALPLATRLEVTEVDLGVRGDTRAPTVDATWDARGSSPWLESATGIRYRFVSYAR